MKTEQRGWIHRAYAAMVFDGLCISGANLTMSLLRENYNLSYNLAGLLLAVLSAGNLVSALLMGILPFRFGERRAALPLISGLALGYFTLTLTGSPMPFLLGFLLIGIGKGSTMHHATVLIGNSSVYRTRSVNLINALFAVGSLSAPVLFLAARSLSQNKAAVIFLTVSGCIVWLLFFSVKTNETVQEKKSLEDLSFLKESHFWFSVLFLFCQQCAEIGVTGWLVTYFRDRGILTGIFSELAITVIWLAMLTGRLMIAFVLPQNSRLRSLPLISLSSFVMYFLLLRCTNGPLALILLFLFGFCMSGGYPTVIAQASASLNNASVGILLPMGGIGAIAMPYLIGIVAERTSIYGGMLCILAAIAFMFISALLIRGTEKRTGTG